VTVRELVKLLQTMPQDVVVVYKFHSDFEVLEAEDVELSVPNDEFGLIHHHGHIMDFDRVRWWDAYRDGAPPEYITAVIFPGN